MVMEGQSPFARGYPATTEFEMRCDRVNYLGPFPRPNHLDSRCGRGY